MGSQLTGCGVILAGGQSSRMGTNKALLEIQGEPLVERLARRFTQWFAQTIIVTNTPETYAFLGLPMVGDRVPGLGPLGGLEAGLRASQFEHAFFCAVDMPFVSEELVRYMFALAPGHDIIVPFRDGEYEPMHAIYGQGCLPSIERYLEARRLKLLNIFDEVRRRNVTAEEIRRFGEPERLFFNCNTPEDIARARLWAQEG